MKRIARIALVVALLIGGMVRPALSDELRWEVLYKQATQRLDTKNKYEIEWERLNQELTDSYIRRDDPDYIVNLAEQIYEYALKHLGGGHPFAEVSYKRLLFDVYQKLSRQDRGILFLTYGLTGLRLLPMDEINNKEKEWMEIYSKACEPVNKDNLQMVISYSEQAYSYAKKYFNYKHPALLVSTKKLAMFRYNAGRYREAEQLTKEAISIQEKLLGVEHPETIDQISRLGGIYNAMGRTNQAILTIKKVLDMHKRFLSEEHFDTIESFKSMVNFYRIQGRDKQAEEISRKTISIYKKYYGMMHLDTYEAMMNLADLQRSKGKKNESEYILKEILDAYSKGPEKHSSRDEILNEANKEYQSLIINNRMSDIYIIKNEYTKAEGLLMKNIDFPLKHLRRDTGERVSSMQRLMNLYVKMKRYRDAEVIIRNLIKINNDGYNVKNKNSIINLKNLAVVCKMQEKKNASEDAFKKAIKLSKEVLGESHYLTIETLAGYIFLLLSSDQDDIALSMTNDWEKKLFSRSFQELYASSSHNTRRLYEQTVNFFMNTVPSLASQRHEEKYQKYAADVILRWKQLYAEEEAFQHQQLANSNAPEIVKLRNNLAGARIKLSQALLQKKNEEELASLMDDYNEAETALLAEAKRFKSNLEVEKVTLDRVLSALPQDSALIEYRQFRSVDLKADKTGELHIAALLLLADPKAKQRFLFRDLGPLAEIEKHLKEENAEAYKRLIAPFDEQIRSLKQLYIAPDGPLNLFSFASLSLPDGRFLAERQQINQLQTGRDLIENGKDFPRGKGLVAIGGAKYVRDSMPAGKTEPAQTLVAYQQRAVRELAEGIRYLPESRREAQNIGELFAKKTGEKPTVLIGDDASEHSLKQLKQPPRVLHLSTHGFYLGDDKKEDGLTEQLRDEAPLLLSGLALAGANNWLQGRVVDSHGDDGLLYSLEVLGLNLHGTELVSLSACDTGKGVVDYSEGVYGLVRAFRTAGAKNVLMTLTPVSDASSRQFMETFYDKWLSSEKSISPAEALHQTRLQFIRDKKPVQDWAPFVLVGK